jgi:sulfate adenylyltransferase (ADP) / ATP adenylyltransferase
MIAPDPWLAPGTLADRLAATGEKALALGALQPIATRQAAVEDGGVRFLVRVVDSLMRKEVQRMRVPSARSQGPADPFLPPDPVLTVGILSDTHVAVLNKFNVLLGHLLLVTRRFEPQESLLAPADLDALLRCLREIDGLGFFNGGTRAGASQAHKHLQLVRLPLAEDGPGLPMEKLLVPDKGNPVVRPPFSHAFARIDTLTTDAASLHRVYLDLIGRVGIRAEARNGTLYQSDPYNVLVTRRWMLAVPRPAEGVGSVSVNALGFAGSLFVKAQSQLDAIIDLGPMRVLCAAAGNAGAL